MIQTNESTNLLNILSRNASAVPETVKVLRIKIFRIPGDFLFIQEIRKGLFLPNKSLGLFFYRMLDCTVILPIPNPYPFYGCRIENIAASIFPCVFNSIDKTMYLSLDLCLN